MTMAQHSKSFQGGDEVKAGTSTEIDSNETKTKKGRVAWVEGNSSKRPVQVNQSNQPEKKKGQGKAKKSEIKKTR